MSNESKKYSIRIFDDEYVILTDESEEHVARVSGHVDSLMREISQRSGLSDPKRIAVLAALKLARDGIEYKASLDEYEARHAHLIKTLEKVPDQSK